MSWFRNAGKLIRAIGSEPNRPLYVLHGWEVPREFEPVNCAGYTAPWLSDALRPWLESHGRWRGPGFACVVCPWRLHGYDRRPEQVALGAVVHEFAHYIVAR